MFLWWAVQHVTWLVTSVPRIEWKKWAPTLLPWQQSTESVDLIGHIMFLPWGQLDGCRPFLSPWRVWLARQGKHLSLFEFCVKLAIANMNKNLFLSSLSEYRLKFFVVKDHLWNGGSLSQLQSSWLRFTQGTQRSAWVHRGCGTESRVRGGPALFIIDDVCGFLTR